MAVNTKAGIKSTSIRAPIGTLDNHQVILQQLKETTEIAQRLRGDPLDSFVRLSELVNAGIIRLTGGVVQPPNPTTPIVVVPIADTVLFWLSF